MTQKDFKLGFVRIYPYCTTHMDKMVKDGDGFFYCSDAVDSSLLCRIKLTALQLENME